MALEAEDFLEPLEDNDSLLLLVVQALSASMVDVLSMIEPERWQQPGPFADQGILVSPPGFVDRLYFLRESAAFANGRMLALASLVQISEFVDCAAGAELWAEGDVSDHGYLLLSGEIEGRRTSSDWILRFFAGHDVGSLESFGGRPRWFSARATSRAQALKLNTSAVLDVFEDETDGDRLLRRPRQGLDRPHRRQPRVREAFERAAAAAAR